MNKITIIATLMFFLTNLHAQDKTLQTPEVKKYVISPEDQKKAFDEIAKDASEKLKEWVKEFKTAPINYKAMKSGKKQTDSAKIANKSYTDELNSQEFKEDQKNLFKYMNEENSEKTRAELELIKKKFPKIYEEEKAGFEYNTAKTFIWEGKYSEAYKALTSAINELKKRYPKGFNSNEIDDRERIFIGSVFGKRGAINLFFYKNYLEASDDLETVVKMMPKCDADPAYYKVYTLLTGALVMQNRIKEGAYYYNKAFQLYPDLKKKPNEHINICKNIINAGYLDKCPPCKDVAN